MAMTHGDETEWAKAAREEEALMEKSMVVVRPDRTLIHLGEAALEQWGRHTDAKVEMHKLDVSIHMSVITVAKVTIWLSFAMFALMVAGYLILRAIGTDAKEVLEIFKYVVQIAVAMLGGAGLTNGVRSFLGKKSAE